MTACRVRAWRTPEVCTWQSSHCACRARVPTHRGSARTSVWWSGLSVVGVSINIFRPSTSANIDPRPIVTSQRARLRLSLFRSSGAPSKRAKLQTSSSPSLESESSDGQQEPFREHTTSSCLGSGWTVRRRGGVCRTHAPLRPRAAPLFANPGAIARAARFDPSKASVLAFLMAHGALPWPRMISFHIVYVHG